MGENSFNNELIRYKFYREKIKLLYELTPKIRTYKYHNKREKNVFFTYYRENCQNM